MMPQGFGMHMMAVGEPYAQGVTELLEGAHVAITPSGLEVRLSYIQPTDEEEQDVTRGRFLFRFVTAPRTIMFLACSGGGGQWSEAPFNLHRLPEEQRTFPASPSSGCGWPMTVVLVDGSTGIVRALRCLVLTHSFSASLDRFLKKQAELSPDDAAHLREIARMQRKSTVALAADAIDRFEANAVARQVR